jgi:hypothetical protein
MHSSSRWLVFFCSSALLLAQPALRLKVHVPANPGIRAPGENPIVRGGRLPRLTPTHVIVQFDQPPTAGALDALKARGAVLLQNVPDNGVLVLMNDTMARDGALDGLGIRSARRLESGEKLSPLITGDNSSAATGYYLVEFHPDVDPNVARRLILTAGLELRENPDLLRRHLLVHIPNSGNARATLESLASQDQVAYIFPAAANLAAGTPVNVCGGALTVLGPIGQIIATNGDGWDGPGLNAATLNYVFQQVTAQLPAGVPQSEILRAMAEWAKVIQITWQPGTDSLGNRTVNIFWATGDHGDGFPFDGPGGVVAHTFYPAPPNPEPLAGDLHLDDAESWHVGTQVDVFSVALHELGHALGLGHSDNPNDVMYPYLKLVSTLADGDKTAILSMYAAQTGVVPPPGPLALTINPPPVTTTAAAISLTGTVTGGSGSPTVTWTSSSGASDGSSISGSNWVISSLPLAIGVNTIVVTVADGTGSVSHVVSITRQGVVAGPLALTINVPPATTTSATISLSGTVTGGSGSPSVTWMTSTGASDGSSINGDTWTILSIPLAMGVNTITVTATDATGSTSHIVSVTRTVAPPPGPLVLTINTPLATTADATISLSGTVTGGSGSPSVHWITNTGASDGSTISGGNWAILSIPLAIGVNTITVTALDATGSVSQAVTVTRTVTMPPGPLVLTINAPLSPTTAATMSLTGTVTGGSGAPAVSWTNSMGAFDGSSISGSNWIISNIPLAIGLNTITVTAADATGSVSHVVSVTRTVNPPPGPLVLTIDAPPSPTTAATMSLTGTVTGGSGGPAIRWTNSMGASDGASISGSNWVISNIPLAIGVNTITVVAADATGSVSRTVSVTRTAIPPPGGTDTSGPALTITYPSSTSLATTLASLTFQGFASDPSGVSSVTFSTNTGRAGTASGTTAWSVAIPLLVGSNQVIIRAYDTLGNMSWRSVIVTRR